MAAENQKIEINAGDESRLIAEAQAAVLNQSKTNEFEAAPYERATALLESLPVATIVDQRVQLALDITSATRTEHRIDLSRRALYAAFPVGSEITQPGLKRKWLTFASVIESNSGNVELAFKYKLLALDLCEQTGDDYGFFIEYCNMAGIASGAGLHLDAFQYANAVIEGTNQRGRDWLSLRGMAFGVRGNAHLRLGRLTEAASDYSQGLMCATHPPDANVRQQIILAQCSLAEIQLDKGNRAAAQAALEAATTWAEASGALRYKLQVQRVRARLLVSDGQLSAALHKLEALLEQAIQMEAEVGGTAYEDAVLETLYTLEKVCRDCGETEAANRWLNQIGDVLRTNATKMLDSIADKRLLRDRLPTISPVEEVDRYLRSKSAALPGAVNRTATPWVHLVGLAASASAAEDSTKEHCVRVAKLAGLVAAELGLTEEMQQDIQAGCQVHDVGKLALPPSILLKSKPLDVGERSMYDAHAGVGADFVERLMPEHGGTHVNIVRFHHHAYDGGAFGVSPKGESIPLEARIAAVCDRYDLLVVGRPRQTAVTSNEALRQIHQQRSLMFDPAIVDVFIDLVRRLRRTHSDLQMFLSEDASRIEYFVVHRALKAKTRQTTPTFSVDDQAAL